MKRQLCIHGHFYQPPREDPWVDSIMPEGSAAPMRHWNERINRESYAPMAWCRLLDGEGRIREILNLYEYISFNFGPTLFKWLETADPSTYQRIIEGDRASQERWGHGNAMAQVYHHLILPLASDLDKEVEVAWAIDDFQARFGRAPQGMWLSEAAVDTATLEVLAKAGISFVVLAPRQAKALRAPDSKEWRPVDQGSLDILRPYEVELPSGKSVAAFFYDGPVSQAVAFERLLEDGERFWRRIQGALPQSYASPDSRPALLSLGTDGETYGHHFAFGEMALGYVLDQARQGRDNIELINYAAYLAAHPPTWKAQLHEPSSWSCVHGVERWRSDCGCTTGGGEGWNQKWREPLRTGLDKVKAGLDAHFFELGAKLFKDPRQTLVQYGKVLAKSVNKEQFSTEYFRDGLSPEEQRRGWKLLSMQQWGLASMASCAWFFEELARIEPLNAMTFCLRAMELARDTGGPDLEPAFLAEMKRARSNFPDKGTGKDLYMSEVLPRQETEATLTARAVLSLWAEDRLCKGCDTPEQDRCAPDRLEWPAVTVSAACNIDKAQPTDPLLSGVATLTWALESGAQTYAWEWERGVSRDPFQTAFRITPQQRGKPSGPSVEFSPTNLPWNRQQAVALRMIEHAARTCRLRQKDMALRGASMFLEFQEAQQTQNLSQYWTALFPALAWAYTCGQTALNTESDAAPLVGFLREHSDTHPDRDLAAEQIVAHALELLTEPNTDALRQVGRMVQRCGEIGLSVDWWPVQNRVWRLRNAGSSPELKETAGLLGFTGF